MPVKDKVLQRVMYTAECDPNGDGWCQVRDCDPATCDCIGPTEDNVGYVWIDGALYGKRLGGSDVNP
jgi:hypothetical protein